jgi:hypothetical protein
MAGEKKGAHIAALGGPIRAYLPSHTYRGKRPPTEAEIQVMSTSLKSRIVPVLGAVAIAAFIYVFRNYLSDSTQQTLVYLGVVL